MANIFYDSVDNVLIEKTAQFLADDIERVSGKKPFTTHRKDDLRGDVIIIGTVGNNSLIDELIATQKLDINPISGTWERYIIKTIENLFPNVSQALVIVGSDRRGAAYGVFSLSEAIGVSPWYWWADVSVQKNKNVYIEHINYTSKAPSVKYRGAFFKRRRLDFASLGCQEY